MGVRRQSRTAQISIFQSEGKQSFLVASAWVRVMVSTLTLSPPLSVHFLHHRHRGGAVMASELWRLRLGGVEWGLQEWDAPPGVHPESGDTILMIAIKCGSEEVARWAASHPKIVLGQENGAGRTVQDIAEEFGRDAWLKPLITGEESPSAAEDGAEFVGERKGNEEEPEVAPIAHKDLRRSNSYRMKTPPVEGVPLGTREVREMKGGNFLDLSKPEIESVYVEPGWLPRRLRGSAPSSRRGSNASMKSDECSEATAGTIPAEGLLEENKHLKALVKDQANLIAELKSTVAKLEGQMKLHNAAMGGPRPNWMRSST
jgi:hypothetical protein